MHNIYMIKRLKLVTMTSSHFRKIIVAIMRLY